MPNDNKAQFHKWYDSPYQGIGSLFGLNDLLCDPEDRDHLWNPTYQWGIRRHTPKLYQDEKIDSSWCCIHSSHFHCDTNMCRKSCYLSYKIRKIVPDQDELNRHWCNASLAASLLKHWDRDKLLDILLTTFSNTFPGMKTFEFQIKFHSDMFLRVQLTLCQHSLR